MYIIIWYYDLLYEGDCVSSYMTVSMDLWISYGANVHNFGTTCYMQHLGLYLQGQGHASDHSSSLMQSAACSS